MKNKPYHVNVYAWRKIEAIKYKGGKCIKCGYDRCYSALEFHHRDKTQKEFCWSQMRNKAWATIIRELDKCDLLCANCHREEHFDKRVLSRIIEWRNEIEEKKVKPQICPGCRNEFKAKQKRVKYCSKACTDNMKLGRSTKIDWPPNLPELVRMSSMRAVAIELGVSDKAVAKRLHKHHAPIV